MLAPPPPAPPAKVKRPAAEGNNAVYIVEFYSDRCPFCISLSPDIIVAAEKVRGEVPNAIVAACNSRIYGEVARSNGVTGYPWVREDGLFPLGERGPAAHTQPPAATPAEHGPSRSVEFVFGATLDA